MGTIAQLVIEIGANASGVRRGLDQANLFLRQFAQTAAATMHTVGGQLRRGAIVGSEAADVLLHNLNTRFNQQVGQVRENMFRGILNKKEAAKQATEAATAYNAALLQGIREIQSRGALSDAALSGLQENLKTAGLTAGKTFGESLGEGLVNAGHQLEAFGQKLFQSVTLPLIGAAATAVTFASETEIAGARLNLVWGRLAETMQQGFGDIKGLRELHVDIPATTKEMENMAAKMGELLLPLAIAPKEAARMSLSLIALSKDLAIINNVDPQRTINALISGMIGLTRPLKLLGVDITDQGIKVQAWAKGIAAAGTELNEQQKALAAYSLIMDRTSLVQHAAAKLTDTFAVQLRFLKRDAYEAGVTFGNVLMPAIRPFLDELIKFVRYLATLNPETVKTILKLGLFAAILGPLAISLGFVTAAVGILTLAFIALKVQGVAALITTIGAGGVIGIFIAMTIAVAALILKLREGNSSMAEFAGNLQRFGQERVAQLSLDNLHKRIALEEELARLQSVPPVQQAITTAAGVVKPILVNPNQSRIREITSQLGALDKAAILIGQRFTQLKDQEADGAAQMKLWDEHMKKFLENAPPLKEKFETPLQRLQKAVAGVIDVLSIHRELNLDIADPLKDAQNRYDSIVKSLGGINNLTGKNKDLLKLVLDLAKAINDATDERARKPIADAKLAESDLRAKIEESLGTAVFNVEDLQGGFENLQEKLDGLDKLRSSSDPAVATDANREANRIRRFMRGINESLLEAQREGIEQVRLVKGGRSIIQQAFVDFGNTLTELMNDNTKRLARLKANFGGGDQGGAASLAAGALNTLAAGALTVAEQFTPLALVSDVVGWALESLQPLLDALKLPLKLVVQVLVTGLIPIFKLLFPVLKYAAIAVAILGEVIFRVVAGILRAIGSFIKALGNFVNAIVPFANPGNPLVRAGEAMQRTADGFTETAEDLAQARRDLQKMSFEDAVDQVKGLADAARDASQNIPQIFKLASAAFNAADPVRNNQASAIFRNTGDISVTPDSSVVTQPAVVNQYQFAENSIKIDAKTKTPSQLFSEVTSEADRLSLALTGTTVAGNA